MQEPSAEMTENPYLVFFLHLERYGLIPSIMRGQIDMEMARSWVERFSLSPSLIAKLLILCKYRD